MCIHCLNNLTDDSVLILSLSNYSYAVLAFFIYLDERDLDQQSTLSPYECSGTVRMREQKLSCCQQ